MGDSPAIIQARRMDSEGTARLLRGEGEYAIPILAGRTHAQVRHTVKIQAVNLALRIGLGQYDQQALGVVPALFLVAIQCTMEPVDFVKHLVGDFALDAYRLLDADLLQFFLSPHAVQLPVYDIL